MLTGIGTASGKFWVGLVVTTLAGGAVMTDTIDVPRDPESLGDLVTDMGEHAGDLAFTVLPETEPLEPLPEVGVTDEADQDPDDPLVAAGEEGDEDNTKVENHGQTVSEFARTTDLEGCEKGQAISEVASSKAAEKRKNADRDHDPCDEVEDDGDADPGVDSDEADQDERPPETANEQPGSDEELDPEKPTEAGRGRGQGKAEGRDRD